MKLYYLFAFFFIFTPFFGFAEEGTFTIREGVSGSYQITDKLLVVHVKASGKQEVKILAIEVNLRGEQISFSLLSQNPSGYGRKSKIAIQWGLKDTRAFWFEWYEFQDKRAHGPPARMKEIRDKKWIALVLQHVRTIMDYCMAEGCCKEAKRKALAGAVEWILSVKLHEPPA
jgi:hypothetical protein